MIFPWFYQSNINISIRLKPEASKDINLSRQLSYSAGKKFFFQKGDAYLEYSWHAILISRLCIFSGHRYSTPQKRRYTSSANEYILTLPMNIYLLCQRRYPHQLLKLNRTKRIHVSGSGRYKKIETRPKPRLYPYLIYNRMIILRLPLQQPHPQQLQLRYLPVRRL